MARLDSAARQMAAFAQSNRLRQLASLMVARNSPAEELQELRELFSGAPSLPPCRTLFHTNACSAGWEQRWGASHLRR